MFPKCRMFSITLRLLIHFHFRFNRCVHIHLCMGAARRSACCMCVWSVRFGSVRFDSPAYMCVCVCSFRIELHKIARAAHSLDESIGICVLRAYEPRRGEMRVSVCLFGVCGCWICIQCTWNLWMRCCLACYPCPMSLTPHMIQRDTHAHTHSRKSLRSVKFRIFVLSLSFGVCHAISLLSNRMCPCTNLDILCLLRVGRISEYVACAMS